MGLFQQTAVKEALHARVALDGPPGSGKSWTALQTARIIAGPDNPIGLIDTENRSAAYYAPSPGETPERLQFWDAPYDFLHLPVSPPFDPRELVKMMSAAAEDLSPDGVLIIDSLTHYWSGEGGTLDIVDNAARRSGNSYTAWSEGTPAQRSLLDAIVHAPYHVVVTMRSKVEYVLQEKEKNGRKIVVPEKIGMKPEQRAGVEYEFTVVGDLDPEHRLVISKSRCDAVADMVLPSGRSHEFGQTFAEWLGTGAQRITPDQVQAIVDALNTPAEKKDRAHLKNDFVAQFGNPASLVETSVAAALAWITERLETQPAADDNPEFDVDPDDIDPTPPLDLGVDQ